MATPSQRTKILKPKVASAGDGDPLRVGDADLAKVRDILFGDQVRGLQELLREFEQRLASQLSEVRSEMADIEARIHSRIDALRDDFDSQRTKLAAETDSEFESIRREKLDQSALSSLLRGLADRLAGDDDE